MNTDIRISTAFREHRKRKKLHHLLGADGVLAVIDLWIGVALSKPCGRLTGWGIDDICLEANWSGDPKKFVDTLVSVGFVEVVDGVYCMRNWEKHQVWACKAEERSARARNAAIKRWDSGR